VDNHDTDAAEYEAQQKKLEGIVSPIISKLYASSSDGMPQPQPSSSSSSEPNIEELD
jgi:hypothetical protein